MSITIKKAEPCDVSWITQELKLFSQELKQKTKMFGSEEYVKQLVSKLVGEHLVLISFEGNTPTGVVAGILSPHFFNPNMIALTELFWWVNPAYRGSGSGKALLNAFIEHGNSVDMIQMALEETSPIDGAVLTRRGFKKVETHYLKEKE